MTMFNLLTSICIKFVSKNLYKLFQVNMNVFRDATYELTRRQTRIEEDLKEKFPISPLDIPSRDIIYSIRCGANVYVPINHVQGARLAVNSRSH